MRSYDKKLPDKIIKAIRWVQDVDSGEMVECGGYTRDYLAFDFATQNDLDYICAVVNHLLERIGSKLRVYSSMGEIHLVEYGDYKERRVLCMIRTVNLKTKVWKGGK